MKAMPEGRGKVREQAGSDAVKRSTGPTGEQRARASRTSRRDALETESASRTGQEKAWGEESRD